MLFDFFIAVMAGIVSGVAVHYICKWLDSQLKSNQPRISIIMQKSLEKPFNSSRGLFFATMLLISIYMFIITCSSKYTSHSLYAIEPVDYSPQKPYKIRIFTPITHFFFLLYPITHFFFLPLPTFFSSHYPLFFPPHKSRIK